MAEMNDRDMEKLREEINSIFYSNEPKDVKNDLIVKLVLKSRRKKLLEKERQQIPSANKNLFAGAGSKEQHTNIHPNILTQHKKPRPAEENKPDRGIKPATSEEPESEKEDNEESDDKDGYEEEEEEEEEEEAEENENVDELNEEDEEDEEENESDEEEKMGTDEQHPSKKPLALSTPTVKPLPTTFLRANESIVNLFAKNVNPLSKKSRETLFQMSQKLSDYFHSKNSKHYVKNNTIFRKSSQKPLLPLDTALCVFSLQTKPLFQFVTYNSKGKFTLAQKQVIKQIYKSARSISLTDIASARVREMFR